MKSILEFLTMISLGRIFELVSGVIKRYLVASYIDFIEQLRTIYFIVILTSICLLLLLSGFLIVHAALFMYLSWSNEHKSILMLIMGCCYMIIPLAIVGITHSRNQWMKRSGAKKMLEDLSNKEQK